MQQPDDQSECANPAFEQSLLTPDAMARWEGCPMAWVETRPHTVHADIVSEQMGLVMTDCGTTHADFRYGNRSTTWQFTPGSIGLFRAGTELNASRWSWTLTRRIYLNLDGAGTDLMEQLGRVPQRTEIEFRDPELTMVLRAMVHEAANGSPNGRLFAESLTLGVAMRLYRREAERFSGSRERGKLGAAQLKAVEDLVASRLQTNISLAEMARVTGFSPAQFVRLFKNSVGCTPHQYVLKARLHRARDLVLASALPLSTVADLTGFSHQSHMNAAFVRAFNAPPGELRRRSGSGNAPG